MKATEVYDAIENGAATREQIADYCDLAPSTVGRNLKDMMSSGDIARDEDTRPYEYFKPAGGDTTDVQETDDEPEPVQNTAEPATIPPMDTDVPPTAPSVSRNYNWTDHCLAEDEVYEYIPTNGEWDEFTAKVDARHITGQEPAFMFGGPTGCGKTTAAEWKAAQDGSPVFTIQMTYDMSPASLLGKATVKGDGEGGTDTVWNDGPITKALLASRAATRDDTDFDYVTLIIDEANRARPEVHSTLMSALDSRCEVTLDQRGGEKVRGVRENLVVVSTINPKGSGDYHGVQDIDFAVKRRLRNAGYYEVDYLGMNYPDREADLVAGRTPAGKSLSALLVETANQIRERADDATSKNVKSGVPTSTVLSWAQSACALDQAGIDNPVVKAAESDVARALYDDSNARSTVSQIVKDNLDGCPFSDADVAAWSGEVEHVSCGGCSYREQASTYEETSESDYMECPDCGDHVMYE